MIFLCSIIIAEEPSKENFSGIHDQKPKITAYTYYVMMREFLYISCFLYWVMDLKTIKECLVFCDDCNYPYDSFYIYGFFTAAADDQILATLKKLLRKGNKQKLINFLLKIYNEYEMDCPRCHKYCGWHQFEKLSVV